MAVDIVITIVEKIGNPLWVLIERQFGYLVRCYKNLESFREELAKLEGLQNRWQDAIDSATKNGRLIRPEVKHWMTKVDGFKDEAMKFLEDALNLDKKCFNGWFPNLVTRYHIGKDAKKKTMAAAKLQDDGKFDIVSSVPPPSGMDSLCLPDFVAYETTKVAFSKVMEALENDNIKFIGIHGMGGVGKTTLVKEVGKQAKEKKLFDEVVMAVVSQNIDIRKIQGQLADMLGLTFDKEGESGRAGQLVARIKGVERILVILDDVWAKFNVMEVGIPFSNDHKGCKIVITTRRSEVCRTMSAAEPTHIVFLNVLTEAESWDLFKKNAGEEVKNPTFNDVARNICEECRGLPVAIVTVGRAMRGKEDPEDWNEVVVELKRSIPINIEGVEDNVYKCIKFSYDYVRDKEAKCCFLLCSMFPEDCDIEIETLVRYAVGLEILEKVYTIQDVRQRVKSVINKLKESCLLIAGKKKGYIKMHDVVRDVALSIGSEKYFVRAGEGLKEWPTKGISDDHTGASLMENEIQELPSNWSGKTKLRILLLQGNKILGENLFFEGMKALRVLDLSCNRRRIFGEIPPTLDSGITCLQTLVLDQNALFNPSVIGQIQTLVVLSLRKCWFKESPTFIRNLTNLKLLDMSRCIGFQTQLSDYTPRFSLILSIFIDTSHVPHIGGIVFEPNSIACLSRLEELYLERTTVIWKFGNELKSLCHLKVLTLKVTSENLNHLPEDFVFPSNLESFTINTKNQSPISKWGPNHLVLLNSDRGTIWWLNCVKALLKRTHHLQVDSFSGARNIIPNISDLDVLESLAVDRCDELEYLINEHEEEWKVDHSHTNPKALSKLQHLFLSNLPSLRGLYNGTLPPSVILLSLSKLRYLSISHCNNLSVAISPFNLLQRLKELETLDITSCRQIREIVTDENNGDAIDRKIVFKSLKMICLKRLPNLDGFCMGSCPFEFPSLEQVDIERCPKMKTFTAAVSVDTAMNQTPKLKEIKLDDVEIMLQGVDLNTVLQNKFKAKEMESASQGSN